MGKRVTAKKKAAKKRIAKAADVFVAERGRPTDFKPEYCELATRAAKLGTTNEGLADFFDVSIGTLERWMSEHEEFRGAVKAGRQFADANVADALYHRATGYSHPAVKIMTRAVGDGCSVIEEVPYTEHYPPDATSAIFWLKNRRPKEWREKIEVEGGGNQGPTLNLTQINIGEKKLSRAEIERKYFEGLKDVTRLGDGKG